MRIGEILIQQGLVDDDQLDRALSSQHQFGQRVGSRLVDLGFISNDVLARALSHQHRVPAAVEKHFATVNKQALKLVPAKLADKFNLVPIGFTSGAPKRLVVACIDPHSTALDEIAFLAGMRIEPAVATETQLTIALAKFYGIKRKARGLEFTPAENQSSMLPQPMHLQANTMPRANPKRDARTTSAKHDAPVAPRAAPVPEVRTLTANVRTSRNAVRVTLPDLEPPPPSMQEPSSASMRIAREVPSNSRMAVSPPRLEMPEAEPEPEQVFEPPPPPPPPPSPLTPPPPPEPTENEYDELEELGPAGMSQVPAELIELGPAGMSQLPPEEFEIPTAKASEKPLAAPVIPAPAPPPAVAAPIAPKPVVVPKPAVVIQPPPASVVTDLDNVDAGWGSEPPAPSPEPVSVAPIAAEKEIAEPIVRAKPTVTARRPARSADDAIAAMNDADSKEAIGDLLVDYMRSIYGYGLVLIVRDHSAVGWKGFAPGVDESSLEDLNVPLTTPSVLRLAYDGLVAFRGAPPPDGEARNSKIWFHLQCAPPREVIVAPVTVGKRVVNLISAHAADGGILPDSASPEMTRIAGAAAAAYLRLLRKK